MKKLIRIAAICAAAVLALTSCSSASGLKTGLWDEKYFVNNWSNIIVHAQGGYFSLTPDEMREITAGEDAEINDPSVAIDTSAVKSLYDMAVFSEDNISNVMLRYDNANLLEGAGNADAAGYFEIIKNRLSEEDSSKYTFLDPAERVIAGETYFVGRVSIEKGLMLRDYYIRRYDNFFIIIIATCMPGMETEIMRFITSFRPYHDKMADQYKDASN